MAKNQAGSIELFCTALKTHVGVKRFLGLGQGPSFDALVGKTNVSFRELKRLIRVALRDSGCSMQKGGFVERRAGDDGTPMFYVQGNDWNASIALTGTARKAYLSIDTDWS